ncbi:hypothetical protein LJC13_01145 [Peptostreptococcaceae bacterium OttesenSCG-928-C18]|nr:hypothetical protein [Peptostreptococcaceae bacterium OttesenSCG-928-C18]
MSISDLFLIDGFGTNDNKTLELIIRDPLVWNKETEDAHMYFLENKFGFYIQYIKEKKYSSMFKDKVFDSFNIKFESEYKLPLKALVHIRKLEKELEPYNIKINMKIASTSNSC